MTSGSTILAAARNWIGTPYRHQASAIGAGTDCLGLIRGVWRELIGAEPERLPAYTPDWDEVGSQEVILTKADQWLRRKSIHLAESGDVIVFRMRETGPAKHLGIYANDTGIPTFIHAYTGHGVMEAPLTPPWQRRIVGRFAFPLGEF